MKQFQEYLPIALFAGVYFYTRDIFVSTGVLMAGMLLLVIYQYLVNKSVSKQTQFIFWSVMVLGGLTLVFRNETFIQWKPTLVNWAFCLVLLVSHYIGKEDLLKKMLGAQIKLPNHVWKNLTFGWSGGFFLAGALNLIVAYNFSMDFWVSYKLIGGFGISLLYIIITMVYLAAGGHLQEQDPESNHKDIKSKP